MKQQQQQQQQPSPPPPQPPQQPSPPFASPGVPAFLSKLWALLGETPSNQLITWSQVGRPPPSPPACGGAPAITLRFAPAGTGACGGREPRRARGGTENGDKATWLGWAGLGCSGEAGSPRPSASPLF